MPLRESCAAGRRSGIMPPCLISQHLRSDGPSDRQSAAIACRARGFPPAHAFLPLPSSCHPTAGSSAPLDDARRRCSRSCSSSERCCPAPPVQTAVSLPLPGGTALIPTPTIRIAATPTLVLPRPAGGNPTPALPSGVGTTPTPFTGLP